MITDENWRHPDDGPELSDGEVHVWRRRVPLGEGSPVPAWECLSQKERERADAFRLSRDRLRYLTAYSALRILLGRYTGKESGRFILAEGPHGKPFLEESARPSWLRFNISHAGAWVLLAFAREREVGVDLETLRRAARAADLAARYFTPEEAKVLSGVAEPERPEAFLRIWVRKEALVKAAGIGIAGLRRAGNLLGERGAAGERGLVTRYDEKIWSLQDLEVEPDIFAAVAREGEGWTLRCWDFPERPAGEEP